jgi:plasmid stabilization system protein ParE
MRVRYTRGAYADLYSIYTYLDRQAAPDALSVKQLIKRRIVSLGDFPHSAPATDEAGVRELTIVRYPYKIYMKSKAVRFAYCTSAIRRANHGLTRAIKLHHTAGQ